LDYSPRRRVVLPFVSRRELARLERERSDAVKRAAVAEDRLAAERAAKDWAILQLTSRFIVKQGAYGLDAEPPQPTPSDPRRFVRLPTEEDDAKLEYYKQCYREAGKSEDEAVVLWEAEMRGEQVRYPYEQTEDDQPTM
jgi:hypothetical protein